MIQSPTPIDSQFVQPVSPDAVKIDNINQVSFDGKDTAPWNKQVNDAKDIFGNSVENSLKKLNSGVTSQQQVTQKIPENYYSAYTKQYDEQKQKEKQPANQNSMSLYGINRSSWQMWTSYNKTKIMMFPNPTDYTLTIPFRGQSSKIRGGTTYTWWYNDLTKSYFDNGSFSMTMQTGNIMPVYRYVNNNRDDIPYGLQTLYRIIEMQNEPKIIQSDGTPNFVYLFYTTYAFPGILIEGVFSPDETISITENTESIFNLNYTVTIMINRVTPNLSSLNEMIQAYSKNNQYW